MLDLFLKLRTHKAFTVDQGSLVFKVTFKIQLLLLQIQLLFLAEKSENLLKKKYFFSNNNSVFVHIIGI